MRAIDIYPGYRAEFDLNTTASVIYSRDPHTVRLGGRLVLPNEVTLVTENTSLLHGVGEPIRSDIELELDEYGRPLSEVVETRGRGVTRRDWYYDGHGNYESIFTVDLAPNKAAGYVWRPEYEGNDNELEKRTNPNLALSALHTPNEAGIVRIELDGAEYVYNAAKRLTRRLLPGRGHMGKATYFDYDQAGNLATVTTNPSSLPVGGRTNEDVTIVKGTPEAGRVQLEFFMGGLPIGNEVREYDLLGRPIYVDGQIGSVDIGRTRYEMHATYHTDEPLAA